MRNSIENKCIHCNKIFCCAQCRIVHEKKMHVFSSNSKLSTCILCNNSHLLKTTDVNQLILQKLHCKELIQHLIDVHLPLQCTKCSTIFKEASDFNTIGTCCSQTKLTNTGIVNKQQPSVNELEMVIESTEGSGTPDDQVDINVDQANVMANQQAENVILLTPNSPWDLLTNNVKEKNTLLNGLEQKGHRTSSSRTSCYEVSCMTDSISSIRNTSSMNYTSPNLLQQMANSPNKNVARQTSTPMQQGGDEGIDKRMLNSHRPRSFDSMSSSTINSNYSSSESDTSPPILVNNPAPAKPVVTTRMPRNKLPQSATPLRQVMSKSIQKALEKHGLPSTFNVPGKKINSPATPRSIPLDLRMSPAMRRAHLPIIPIQSENVNTTNIAAATATKTKTIHKRLVMMQSITHLSEVELDTVYETCNSFEESSATDGSEEVINITDQSEETPKTSGILKKSTSFAERNSMAEEDDDEEPATDTNEREQWYTPPTTITSRKTFISSDIKHRNKSPRTEISFHEKLLAPNVKESESEHKASSSSGTTIWSTIARSLARMASLGDVKTELKQTVTSTLKRCATFAGRRPSCEADDIERQSVKRRRNSTIELPVELNAKRQRIQGRPPIDRLRKQLN